MLVPVSLELCGGLRTGMQVIALRHGTLENSVVLWLAAAV